MIRLGDLMMILELHRRELSVTAIARRTRRDPKTVRKYIERGIEAPAYGPRSVGRPSRLAPYMDFVHERVTAFPDVSAVRLTRDIRELGYRGAYTAVKRYLAAIRPDTGPKPYEVRFETPPGVQAQVDFARFVVNFTDDPGTVRIVWLFSLELGLLYLRAVRPSSGSADALRCHIQAFEAMGGVLTRDPLRPGRPRLPARMIRATSSITARCWRWRIITGSSPVRPTVSGQNQGRRRAAVPLYPRGLLLGARLPQSRRSEHPSARLARHRCQRPRPRYHSARRCGGVR